MKNTKKLIFTLRMRINCSQECTLKGGTTTNMAASVDLQKAVRQLISSVTSPPSGSQSKVLSLEDAVANLETTDENFHR